MYARTLGVAFANNMSSCSLENFALIGDLEVIADAEGRFQFTYTLEQFSNGEGISTFRRSREKNADLSFCVFESTGQELSIRCIEA